jgi:hypothetical protein
VGRLFSDPKQNKRNLSKNQIVWWRKKVVYACFRIEARQQQQSELKETKKMK